MGDVCEVITALTLGWKGHLALTDNVATVCVLPGSPMQAPDHSSPGALSSLFDQHL